MKGTIAKIFLFTLLALSVAWPHAARAEDPTRDIDQSTRLTDYLQSHQLPLVGAQVLRFSNQGEVVMLYGYSASELGKNYAEERTRLFLQDPDIPEGEEAETGRLLPAARASACTAASVAAGSAAET